jgi:hypothetical protein
MTDVDLPRLIASERRRTGESLAAVVERLRREGRMRTPARPSARQDARVRHLEYAVEDLTEDLESRDYPAAVRRKIVAARRLLDEAVDALRSDRR